MTDTASSQLIHKAALLLDLRGDSEGAVQVLEQAIEVAWLAADLAHFSEAHCFLGELLLDLGEREKATLHFNAVLALQVPSDLEEVVSKYRKTAQATLAEIQ